MPDPRTVAGLTENALLAHLLSELPHRLTFDASLVAGVGEGDDCAIVRGLARGGRHLLLKTDCIIEGRHFLPTTPAQQIGWKALARPLSDLASCAAKPLHALITLALPGETPLERARGIYAGIARCAAEFDVLIAGGETARTEGPLWLSVTLTGEARPKRCPTRLDGHPGDLLFVTGVLGGSFASGRHLYFRPRLEEGRWLAKHFPVRAMMDISDGLGSDLPRLAAASGTGYRIEREALPVRDGCTVEQAIRDGEDYELLFSIAPKHAAKLVKHFAARFPDVPLARIGELTAPGEGQELPRGYDHFA